MGTVGSKFDDYLEEEGLLDQCRNEAIARRIKMTKFAKVTSFIGLVVIATVLVVIPFGLASIKSVNKFAAVNITMFYMIWLGHPIINWLKKQVMLMNGKKE